MRIYHYTTIETLALILHNKTIRFSRLDTVDDPDEYGFEKDAHNPAKYTYVSCWTTNNKESIPQWVMYGNQKRGVRISLDSNLFEIEEKGRHKYILKYKEQEKNDYFIMRKQSFRAVLCTLIYISTFVPNLNFGQDEHKRRRQVLCLNGSQVPNRVQEQEPSRVL